MHNTPSRRRTPAPSGGELITSQAHKQESDISYILNQYKKTGILTHISNQQPIYTELPDTYDYQHAMNLTIQADAAFNSLPSVVRRYFDNDPSKLLAAMNDPAMEDKLRELGILEPKPAPQPPGNPSNTTTHPAANPPELP